MTKPTDRAKHLAKSAAIAAAVAAAAWASYTATRPDADIKREAEREVTVEGEWYSAGGTLKHGKRKLKPSELAAAVAAGIVAKNCGTVKEHGKKCPKKYPKAKRCACCGGKPGTDCEGGTLCRREKQHGEAACDPDAVGCVPWPCTIFAGEAPPLIAGESSAVAK